MKHNLPRLACFVSAMVGLVALSGCTSQTAQPIPTGQNIVRTAEELRVVRQALEQFHTRESGGETFSVPGASGKPVSLFLTADEAALLGPMDHRQILEVRYWYHEADYGFGETGEAELESIRAGDTMILDRTRCRMHNQVMTRRAVRISYGLPRREFVEALHHDFPNAAIQLGGCVVTNFSAKETPAYVCAVCDVAYQTWWPTAEKERAP